MARTSLSDVTNGVDWKPMQAADGAAKMKGSDTDYIEGHLVKIKDGVGKHNSRVYELRIVEPDVQKYGKYKGFGSEGALVNLWGSTVIDNKMSNIRLGQWVRIEYKGKKLKKSSEGKHPSMLGMNDYVNLFEFIVDSDIPDMAVEGEPAYSPAKNNAAPAKAVAKTAEPAVVPDSLDDDLVAAPIVDDHEESFDGETFTGDDDDLDM